MYFDPTYYLYALPGVILLFLAQIMVKSRYNKYSRILNSRGLTGRDAAAEVLAANGVTGVSIETIRGNLTDHFDPTTNTIRLSDGVYDASSISAVGIAAHEAGHAVQYAKGYAPIKIRSAIVPVCNLGAKIGPVLVIIGLMLSARTEGSGIGDYLSIIGLALFALVLVFQLVTLPVEFNASARAVKTIGRAGLLAPGAEQNGAKKVLTAAAMTYVASMFQSLLILLYYISRVSGNKRR